jgi:hypothetical protein
LTAKLVATNVGSCATTASCRASFTVWREQACYDAAVTAGVAGAAAVVPFAPTPEPLLDPTKAITAADIAEAAQAALAAEKAKPPKKIVAASRPAARVAAGDDGTNALREHAANFFAGLITSSPTGAAVRAATLSDYSND